MNSTDTNTPAGARRVPLRSKREWALYWHEAGFSVMPSSRRLIDPPEGEGESKKLTREEIETYWEAHPNDDVFCSDKGYVGLQTTTEAAAAALLEIQIEHGLPPLVTVFGDDTTTLILAIDPDAAAKAGSPPELHSGDCITVQLFENAPLPSDPGAALHYLGVKATDLHSVSLEAVAALQAHNTSLPIGVAVDAAHPLEKFSITNKANELRRKLVESCHVLRDIALRGQSTVIYAPPNTGKTLITLFLALEAMRDGAIVPASFFYVDVDDGAAGLVEKAELAHKYGFHIVAEGEAEFKAAAMSGVLDELIKDKLAGNAIVILDTAKRFTDLMDKRQASIFTAKVRAFVMAGGTIIALAHTNKRRDPNGRLIYGGTSDIVDDFDCAYIVDEVAAEGQSKTVKFTNFKRRGDVAEKVTFAYSTTRGIEYEQLLASVRRVDDEEAAAIEQAAVRNADLPLVRVIADCITKGFVMRMDLIHEAGRIGGLSHKKVIAVIDRYTGVEPALHWWTFIVGARGAKVYRLIDRGL